MTPDSNRLECKHQLTSSLEKEVIAFLNYRNVGIIHPGIDDKTGKPVGIENADQIQLQVKDRIKNKVIKYDDREKADKVYNYPYSAIEIISYSGAIGGAISGAIKLTKRQQEIILLIEQNNKIAYREVAEKLGINNSAVQSHFDALKEKGVLKRIGGTRGHWDVHK